MLSKSFIISASVGLLVGSFIAYYYFKKECDDDEDQNTDSQQLSHHPKNEKVPIKSNDYAVTLNPVAENEIFKVEINAIQEIHQDETRAPPQVDEFKEVPQVELKEPPQQLESNGTVKLEKVTVENESTIDNSVSPSEESQVKKEEDVVEPNTSIQDSGDGENQDETAATEEMTEEYDESMAKLQQLQDIHLAIKSVNYSKSIHYPNGIINFGNSCFVNGILQSLAVCDQFVKIFELIGDWEEVNDYPVINMFKSFFNTYFKKRSVIKPDMIMPLMENYCLSISGLAIDSIDQQDSHEFMEYGLAILDCELEHLMGQLEKSAASASITPPQESSSSSKPPGKELKVSPIKQMFYGSLRSHILTEDNIKKTSIKEFSSLQVSITHDAIKSVKDALNYYTMPEMIEYINEKDQSRTMALEYAEFESLPNMLVIQLLRFEYSSGAPIKITKKIDIPEKLELSVYEDKNDENGQLIIKEYSLVSVVNHLGSGIGFGHYFCYSLFNNIWYLCDDLYVLGPSASRAFNRNGEPYILFYKFDRIK